MFPGRGSAPAREHQSMIVETLARRQPGSRARKKTLVAAVAGFQDSGVYFVKPRSVMSSR